MAKSGVVENHTLTVQGKMKVDGGEVILEEVLGVGTIALVDLLTGFNGDNVKISVAKREEVVKEEEEY